MDSKLAINSKPVINRGDIARLILTVVGISGLVVVGALCPNLLQLIPKSQRRRYSSHGLLQAVYRLDEKRWLIATKNDSGWKIRLTKQGREELLAYELGLKQIMRPKKWDHKWRMLIFDISEKRKWQREKIRSVLRRFHFYRLQDSVWVHPFECEHILDLLRTKYQVRNETLYIRAEYIGQDHWLKKEFGLK